MSPRGSSLVVGASGQVGAQIVSILGPGATFATSRTGTAPGVIRLDLAALTSEGARAFIAGLDLAAIYCVGGLTDVERCESESGLALRTNCEGPAHLAAAAAARKLPFVYFSTEYVFDGIAGPYTEDAKPGPINAYGRSKWQGEAAVLEAHRHALIIRTTVVYGPDAGGKNFLCRLRHALQQGRPTRVPQDQISTPTYNRDLAANAVALVAAGATGVFHVCGPERMSRLQFSRLATRLMGFDESLIIGVPTSELAQRARRPLNAGLSTEKLRKANLHLPMRTLAESLRDWMAT